MAPQPAALVALVVALLSHPVLAQQAPPAVRDLNPGKPVKDHLQPFTPWAKTFIDYTVRLVNAQENLREKGDERVRAAGMYGEYGYLKFLHVLIIRFKNTK